MSNTTTYQYTMKFNADTSAAKKQIEDLQSSLDRLISGTGTAKDLPITQSLAAAQSKAAELRVALEGATNVNTGKLDLSKFAESLARNGTSLEQYRQSLNKLGPEGQTAFLRLSTAISQAEVPLKRTSTLMTNFANTMKNAVKWQLSSSLIHGFMSSLSTAWNYAQDLNESLNNIRIVTGYNVDQMSAFADQANRAAKALSTTTTSYTDASLIYYQQGLSDKEVQARTNTTIKLANVSGQSVDESAEQLTSIWNNYAEGADNLEYYADVLVKLGAATASSSEEIATGLSKFAATGETVGLSYEYAASALATITATTRESADTVGTALKTLFARIQDLEQGQTLDDGTTLGQYSEALNKVGVNIKTVTGEVKDMDVILDEVGEKWGTMSKDAQIALAQNVAGVRQYTQFMALMNNYDFFKENVATAENSSGELEVQQEIYAESWEAASNRVQASLETIYAALLDDEFFISLTNGVASFTDALGGVIEKAGGLKGVVAMLSPLLFKLFGSELATGIDNIIYRIANLGNTTSKMVEKLKAENTTAQKNTGKDVGDNSEYVMANAWSGVEKTQSAMLMRSKELTAEKKQQLQIEQNIIADQAEQLIQDAHRLETLEAQTEYLKEQAASGIQSAQESHVSSDNYFTNDGKKNARFKTKGSVYSRNDLTDEEKLNELNQAEALNLSRQKLIQQKGEEGQYPQDRKELENIKTNLETIKKLKAEIAIKGLFSSEEIKNGETLMSKYEESLKAQKSLQKINSDIQKKGISSETGTQYSKEDIASLKEYVNQVKAMPGVVGEAETAVNALDEALQTGDSEKIQQALEGLGTSSQEAKKKAEDLSGKIQNLVNDLRAMGKNEAADALQEFANSAQKTADETLKAGNNVVNFQTKVKQFITDVANARTKSVSLGEAVSGIGQTFSSVASLVSTVSTLIKTFNDDSASTGEKMLALAQALGFGLMSLSGIFNQNTRLIAKSTISKIAYALAAKTAAAATKSEAAASEENTKAKVAEGAATGATTIATGYYAAAASIAAVAVLALIGIVYLIVKAFKEEESVLEKQQKAINSLSSIVDAATEAYEKLLNSISNYEDARDNLKELTSGTAEFKQKVIEANQEILTLMSSIDGLGQFITVDENGLLNLSEEGLDFIDDTITERASHASILDTQIAAQSAELERDQEIQDYEIETTIYQKAGDESDAWDKYLESEWGEGYTIQKGKEYTSVDENGNEITITGKSVIGPDGEVVADLSPAASRDIVEQYISDDDYLEYKTEMVSGFKQLDTSLSQIAQDFGNILTLDEEGNFVSNADGAYSKKDLTWLNANRDVAFQAIQDEIVYQQKQDLYKDNILSQQLNTADSYTEGSAAQQSYIRNQVKKDLENDESQVSQKKQEIKAGYNQITEDEEKSDLGVELLKSFYGIDAKEIVFESGGVFKAKDAEGESVFEGTDWQQFLDTMAEQQAIEDLSGDLSDEYAERFGQAVNAIQENSNISTDLAEKVVAGTVQSDELTLEEINTLQQLIDSNENEGLYDKDKLSNQVDSANEARSDAISSSDYDFIDNTVAAFSKLDQLGASEITSLAQGLTTVFEKGGATAVDATVDILENSDLSIGELEELLTDVDWDTVGIEELNNLLEDAGVETDGLGDALLSLRQAMSSTGVDNAINQYNRLSQTLSLISGDTIDADVYAELSENSQSYFQLMSDGTYKLIGDAQEFYSLVWNEANAGFVQAIAEGLSREVTGAYNTDKKYVIQNDDGTTSLDFSQLEVIRASSATKEEEAAIMQPIIDLIAAKDKDAGEKFQLLLDNDSFNVESVLDLINTYNELGITVEDINQAQQENSDSIQENINCILSQATSLSELNNGYNLLQSNILASTGLIITSTDAYDKQLITLGKSSATCSSETVAFEKALKDGTDEEKAAAKQALKLALAQEEIMKTTSAAAKTIRSALSTLEDLTDEYGDGAKELYEYKEALGEIVSALNEVFGTDDITSDFVASNLGLIDEMLNGSESAFQEFQSLMQDSGIDIKVAVDDEEAFAELQGLEFYFQGLDGETVTFVVDGYADLDEMVNVFAATLMAMGRTAEQAAAEISAILSNQLGGYDIAVTPVDTQEVLDAYNMLPQVNDITVGGSITSSTGMSTSWEGSVPKITYRTEPVTTSNPVFETEVTKDGYDKNPFSGTSAGKSSGGSGGSGGGGGGGGSSSPAKKVQKTKFTDNFERYHTITKLLEDQIRAADKLAKAEDRLYGKAKIAAMKEETAEMQAQLGLLKQKKEEAEAYLIEDKAGLAENVAAFNEAYGTNLTIEYNDQGRVLNYREIGEEATRIVNEWEDKYNSYATQEEQDTDENQQYQENLDNAMTNLTDSIDQVTETVETIQDIDDSIEDTIDDMQAKYFNTWTAELDLIIDKIDRHLKLTEDNNKILGITNDNIYTAQDYANSVKWDLLDIGENFVGDFLGIEMVDKLSTFDLDYSSFAFDFENIVKDTNNPIGALYEQYRTGQINQAQFVEGLETLSDEIVEYGINFREKIEEAVEGESNAIADVQERMDIFNDKLDNASSSLEHYSNLLDLAGRETDYASKKTVLEAQVEVKTSAVNIAKQEVDTFAAEYERVKKVYDSLEDETLRLEYEQVLNDAYTAWADAQDAYLTSAEEYAEAWRALTENELELINQQITEKLLGSDKSWDAVNDQLDRYSSIGEEYLTDTNKIYEITKMTRDIQSEIDSTSNSAAKQRLATFQKQTKELGEQQELTEYELELQQKKYDLLLAEIALEEAQNAKSQVRLTRDSEGNYSYTYTADENTIQDAEDEYLLKQNELYNYALDGANDYYTKFVQTTEEYQNALYELNQKYLNGEIATEEEYQRQKLEIQSYYSGILTTYKNLYNLTMDELNDKAVESWTTSTGLIISTADYGTKEVAGAGYSLNTAYNEIGETLGLILIGEDGMASKIATFADLSGDYLLNNDDSAKKAVENYRENIEGQKSPICDVFKSMDTAIGEVVTATQALETEATNSISYFNEQLAVINATTAGILEQAAAYVELIGRITEYNTAINQEIDDQAEGKGVQQEGEIEPPEEEETYESDPPIEEEEEKTGITYDMIKEICMSINRGYWPAGFDNRKAYSIKLGYPEGAYEIAQYAVNDVYSRANKGNGSYLNDWDSAIKHELEKAGYAFDTGGYTGEWGEDGRLALLHQKEIVLNSDDTKNFLSTIEIVRDLISTIDLNTLSSTLGGISALDSSYNTVATEREALEQQIQIEASFPNATDRNEIAEAFRGLADLASQYASRRA